MNWMKVFITGIIGGIAVCAYNYCVHTFIMGSTYGKYDLFRQEAPNPIWFFVVSIAIGIAGALLFAKTRGSWPEGLKGGLKFGLIVGLIVFFYQFFNPLTLEGFPYHLSWCWGSIELIGWLIFGVVAGLMIKKKA